MNRRRLQNGRPLYRCVFPLIMGLALVPLTLQVGCSKETDSGTTGGKASEVSSGPPPVPSNLPPEIQARIAKEKAEFESRSQQSRLHAQTPSDNVTKKQ